MSLQKCTVVALKKIIRENKTKTTPPYSKLNKKQLINLIKTCFPTCDPTNGAVDVAAQMETGEIIQIVKEPDGSIAIF